MPALGLAYSTHRYALFRLANGDAAEALRTAREAIALYEGLPSRSGKELFELACCCAAISTLAGSGVSESEAKGEADQAIALLRQAVAEGFTDAETIAKEPVLDSLRNRPDFKTIMEGPAFRANPALP